MARAVTGEENSSDTYRNFQTHTGGALRASACRGWINDHGGKDARQGQRGSSAKEDGVDVVFQLVGHRRRVHGAAAHPLAGRLGAGRS